MATNHILYRGSGTDIEETFLTEDNLPMDLSAYNVVLYTAPVLNTFTIKSTTGNLVTLFISELDSMDLAVDDEFNYALTLINKTTHKADYGIIGKLIVFDPEDVKADFDLDTSTDFEIKFRWVNDADTAIPIADYNPVFNVMIGSPTGVPLTGTTLSVVADEVTATIPLAVYSQIPNKLLYVYYDIQLTTPNGAVFKLMSGKLNKRW